jgi:ribonuclease HI
MEGNTIMNRPYMTQYTNNLSIEMFNNSDTLNLFSDASMRNYSKSNNLLAGCYGSVAVAGDRIIDEDIRCTSITTVPAAELRGLRLSLGLALTYRSLFKVINIFSDSQLVIFGLRDYIYKWRWNENKQQYYTASSNTPVKNQELYIECFKMLQELSKTNIVNLFHQPGHIDSSFRDIKKAANMFKEYNGVSGLVSYDLIRYISIYNNYIDNKTRSHIRITNVFDNDYHDAIEFYPTKNLYINSFYD